VNELIITMCPDSDCWIAATSDFEENSPASSHQIHHQQNYRAAHQSMLDDQQEEEEACTIVIPSLNNNSHFDYSYGGYPSELHRDAISINTPTGAHHHHHQQHLKLVVLTPSFSTNKKNNKPKAVEKILKRERGISQAIGSPVFTSTPTRVAVVAAGAADEQGSATTYRSSTAAAAKYRNKRQAAAQAIGRTVVGTGVALILCGLVTAILGIYGYTISVRTSFLFIQQIFNSLGKYHFFFLAFNRQRKNFQFRFKITTLFIVYGSPFHSSCTNQTRSEVIPRLTFAWQ
jgi:hypothetical protein